MRDRAAADRSGTEDWKSAQVRTPRLVGPPDVKLVLMLHRGAYDHWKSALAGVTNPPVKQLKFRFRYFQELAGTITLPEGFEAERVILSIKPGGKGKSEPVKKTFDWPAQDFG